MRIYPKRLVKALVYTGASIFFIFHEYGTNLLGADKPWGGAFERVGVLRSQVLLLD